jgi:hypothetical protein
MDQAKLNRGRAQDRAELVTLLTAVNGAMNSVRRDDCGDWIIAGSRGTIRACNGKYLVYIPSGSAMAWTYAKKQLASFTTPHQDGDDEGILTLSRMPDENEAATLRRYIGLRQTRDIPPDRAQNLWNPAQKPRIGPHMRPQQSHAPLRPGDMGAYEAGNVRIVRAEVNNREAQQTKRRLRQSGSQAPQRRETASDRITATRGDI